MEDKRDGFFFYRSFYEAIQLVPNDTSKLKLYQALAEYAILNKEPDIEGWDLALFMTWKTNVDKSVARREAAIQNGNKGGRPKKFEGKANNKQKEPNRNLKLKSENPIKNLVDLKEPNTYPNNNINHNSEIEFDVINEFQLEQEDILSFTSDDPLSGVIGESMIRMIDKEFNFEFRYNEFLKNNPSTSFDEIIKELLIQYNEKYDNLSVEQKLDYSPFPSWKNYQKLVQSESAPILIFYEMVKNHQYILADSDPRNSFYITPF
jgi:hypothetical protein